MKPLYVAAAVGALLLPMPTWGQGSGSTAGHVVPGSESVGANGLLFNPYSSSNPLPTSATGTVVKGTPVQTSASCGIVSTNALSASLVTTFLMVQLPSAALNSVWFDFSGGTPALAPPSIELRPGGSINWSAGNGYVPTSQVNCSASATASVTIVYK